MKKTSKKQLTKKPALLILSILLVILGVFAFLELSGKTHIFRKQKASSGEIPVVSTTEPTEESPNNNESAPSTPPTQTPESPKQPSTSTPATGEGPTGPSGNFVSNHHPNLDGNPAPSSIQSVCNTSPGASCYIEFKNGDVVKTLPTKTADSSGAVYWTWDIKQAGFTTGKWEITAIATQNNKTASTKDSLLLEVEP
jgi:cytoskeletal protein RodZ